MIGAGGEDELAREFLRRLMAGKIMRRNFDPVFPQIQVFKKQLSCGVEIGS